MLVAGETLNIFLLPGILNINIFFIKKKNNVSVNSNILTVLFEMSLLERAKAIHLVLIHKEPFFEV